MSAKTIIIIIGIIVSILLGVYMWPIYLVVGVILSATAGFMASLTGKVELEPTEWLIGMLGIAFFWPAALVVAIFFPEIK